MSISVTPLSAALGAEVTGADLNRELDAKTVAELRAAWLDHIVLVFHGQTISERNQRRFAAYFGAVGERARPAPPWRVEAFRVALLGTLLLLAIAALPLGAPSDATPTVEPRVRPVDTALIKMKMASSGSTA